ncbi:MAG: hypothetical protein RJQ09_16260 [Cyclobacteriaceae bacterium]
MRLGNRFSPILIFLIISCKQPRTNLEGWWNFDPLVKHVYDTISRDYDLDTQIEKIAVKSDSGAIIILFKSDSIIGYEPYTTVNIAEFYFDNATQGVLSNYELDTAIRIPLNDKLDYRVYARNYNFSLYKKNDRTYLLIDHGFNQFGRSIDTLEYKIISRNEIEIKGKKIQRIKSFD